MIELEGKLRDVLGTRVQIERKEVGGHIMIDFFSNDDLKTLVDIMNTRGCAEVFSSQSRATSAAAGVSSTGDALAGSSVSTEPEAPVDDRSREEIKAEENDEELYSLKNFSI